MITLDGQVWLQANGLPVGEPVSLVLLAPDGTSCNIPSDQIEADPVTVNGPGAAQAFVNPAECANVEGVWLATFSAAGTETSVRFLVVLASPR